MEEVKTETGFRGRTLPERLEGWKDGRGAEMVEEGRRKRAVKWLAQRTDRRGDSAVEVLPSLKRLKQVSTQGSRRRPCPHRVSATGYIRTA